MLQTPTPKTLLARLVNGISPSSVALAYADWLGHLAASPERQAALATSAATKAAHWLEHARHGWRDDCAPCAAAADRRFARPEWRHKPWCGLAQAFLLQEQWWNEAMTGLPGVSRHHEEVAAFATRQWLDMWSPSNFVATNPQVLRQTAVTGGVNLASGLANWLRDAAAVVGNLPPRGVEAFAVGRDVAVTPGQVVMRNELIELIQYQPATPRVDAEAVLIVPSWIMKFYILDLTPQDSMVKYLVDRGHTVFMVSWKNPGSADRGLGLEDYVQQGVMAALRAVRERVPGHKVHAMGYCLGGTLLAIAAAALAADPMAPLATVTLLAAQVDYTEPGELGLFIDESQIAFVEDLMAGPGYLDGREMAGAFALLNSKDLVWSKLVHEYLMGAQTPMTAMRAWNADATRLPARMHSEYLRSLYLHNDLAAGRFTVAGKPVDLAAVRVPMYVVAMERDHVSPWRSVYKIMRLASSPARFVLAAGGHNVGIVNPPHGPLASPEAAYRAADIAAGTAPAIANDWSAAATPHSGSWWTDWQHWLHRHSSGTVVARKPRGLVEQGAPVAAPGAYVMQA